MGSENQHKEKVTQEFQFSIEENAVSLLPHEDITATEIFRVTEKGIQRIEFYKYNTWVVAYMLCIDGDWGSLCMDENFMSLYEGEDSYEAILKHSGVLDKHKIKTFRR